MPAAVTTATLFGGAKTGFWGLRLRGGQEDAQKEESSLYPVGLGRGRAGCEAACDLSRHLQREDL